MSDLFDTPFGEIPDISPSMMGGCPCGWRPRRGVIGGETLAEHQSLCIQVRETSASMNERVVLPEIYTIPVPGLEFKRQHSSVGLVGYFADMPGEHRAFDRIGYQVYEWKGDWSYERCGALYPPMPPFRGRTADLLKAFQYCAQDAIEFIRLRTWFTHMRRTDPPQMIDWDRLLK